MSPGAPGWTTPALIGSLTVMPTHDQSPNLTTLINRMLQGDQEAGEHAIAALYTTLRRIASGQMRRERVGHLLETRALINEAILRLFGSRHVTVKDRQHFLALMCLTMKRILIEAGRRHEPTFTSLNEAMAGLEERDEVKIFDIQRILERFRGLDPQAYRAFELRIGLGLTAGEAAEEMGCSLPTINRCMKRARPWLFKELSPYLD